jgi:hypothetical protein
MIALDKRTNPKLPTEDALKLIDTGSTGEQHFFI